MKNDPPAKYLILPIDSLHPQNVHINQNTGNFGKTNRNYFHALNISGSFNPLVLTAHLNIFFNRFLPGVEQQGAPGFFKGVGKGVAGVVVKPVGGVFDSVSVILDGFRRVTQYGTQRAERVRPPRSSIPSEV